MAANHNLALALVHARRLLVREHEWLNDGRLVIQWPLLPWDRMRSSLWGSGDYGRRARARPGYGGAVPRAHRVVASRLISPRRRLQARMPSPALTLIPTLNPTTSTSSHPTVVPNCSAATEGELPYLGDGWCDAKYNSVACNYDNGDCCGKSCISFSYHCGSNGYTCIDPAYMNIPSSQPTNIRPTGSPTLYQIAPMVSISQ